VGKIVFNLFPAPLPRNDDFANRKSFAGGMRLCLGIIVSHQPSRANLGLVLLSGIRGLRRGQVFFRFLGANILLITADCTFFRSSPGIA
jgi:hypothetical protein